MVGRARVQYLSTAALAACIGLTYLFPLLDRATVYRLTREDGLVESLGALCLAGAAMMLGWAFFISRQAPVFPGQRRRRSALHLLLGLLLLLACMEEISWGQRLLNWQTPSVLQELNRQKEVNIHNLHWFHGRDESGQEKGFVGKLINGDRIFAVFSFSLLLVWPLAHRWSPRVRSLSRRFGVPVASLGIGLVLAWNHGLARLVEAIMPQYHHSAVELKEANMGVLYFCFAVAEWRRLRVVRSVLVRVESRGGHGRAPEPAVVGGSAESEGVECNR